MNQIQDSILVDSLEESELEKLRAEIKRKSSELKEKNEIINSLRIQKEDLTRNFEDLARDFEELESSEQIMRQKADRLNKEINEKDETIDALSHAQRELEVANENLSRKLEARVGQIQKICDKLSQAEKDLEAAATREELYKSELQNLTVEVKASKRSMRGRDDSEDLHAEISELKQRNLKLISEQNKLKSDLCELNQLKEKLSQLQQLNDKLTNDIKVANSESSRRQHNTTPSNTSDSENLPYDDLIHELYNLRAQVKSLSHRQSRRSIDEEIAKLKKELEVTETSWRLERQHKERYAKENLQLDRRVNELTKEIASMHQRYEEVESRLHQIENLPQQPVPRAVSSLEQHENKSELTSAIRYTVHEEVGEIMDSKSLPKNDRHQMKADQQMSANFRIKKSPFMPDPLTEQKMRIERANELARRNMQTKPLHQTSYPLELDTFDTTNLTEIDIKRGLTNKSTIARQQQHARVLTDTSNQRRPIKKAEAFIV